MPQIWKLLASSPLYHVNNDCESWSFFVCVQNFVHFFSPFLCVKVKCPHVSQLFLVVLHYVVKTGIAYCVLKEWDYGI